MKRILKILIMMFLSNVGFSQIYPDMMQESDSTFSIMYSDSTNTFKYGQFEIRNDSLCIVGDSCFISINKYKWVDFDTSGVSPSYLEGRLYYDTLTNALTFYDDVDDSALQIGQEERIRVFNSTLDTIANGLALSVTGVTADNIVEVGLADASSAVSAINTIGIATHSIEPSSYGWGTVSGVVSGVNSSAYTTGSAIYLSDSIPGTYTEIRPKSPSWEVRMGGVIKSDTTNGKYYAEIRIINNDQDNTSFYNGSILEPNKVEITSNGTTVNLSLISLAPNKNLSLIFDQQYLSVADSINIDLTLGTDTVPVENWVYIDEDGVISKSLSGFPTGFQYVPLARVLVPSATTSQSYGVYKCLSFSDHLQNEVGQGHLTHINDWIRKRPAVWQNGVVLTQSVTEGTSAATIDLLYTSGVVSQLHDHTFPIYNTATKPAFVINDFDTLYVQSNGITPLIDEDSGGNAIGNNKYYNLVVWGVLSEENKDCKLIFNLPNGSYTNLADALNDVNTTTDYTIPSKYLGTGFLINKFTVKRTTSSVTIMEGGTVDLRGSIPAIGGGSVITPSGITIFDELTDTPISKVGESLKAVRVNVGETALEYYIPITDLDVQFEYVGGGWSILIYDQNANILDTEIIPGVINFFSIDNSGNGVAASFITSDAAYEIPFKDGNGINVYKSGSDIIHEIDSSVVATQYDITQVNQALTDSIALDLDRDTLNEGLLSFTNVGSGVYRIESNTVGGATPFFNESTNDPLLDWNISGNSIAMNLNDDLSQYDNSISGFLTSQNWTLSGGNVYRSTGNVGIQTTTPIYDLQVGLASAGTTISDATIFTQGAGGASSTVLQNRIFVGMNNNQGYGSYLGHLNIDYSTGQVAVLGSRYAGVDYPSLYSRLGKIGIGTNNPSEKLQVIGNIETSGTVEYNTQGGVATVLLGLDADNKITNNVSSILPINYWTLSGSDIYRATGKVGVGTSTPKYKLQIGSASTGTVVPGINMFLEGNGGSSSTDLQTGVFLGMNNNQGYGSYFGHINVDYSGGQIGVLGTRYSGIDYPTMYIRASQVGIGTSSPSEKLDVVGNAEINGNLEVTDNLEGNAVNIAGYDSGNKMTRVSIGTGVSLSSGTLSVPSAVQSLGSAFMNDIDYDTGDFPGYQNVAILSTIEQNGDVSVNTGLEQIEIDGDGSGYYMVSVEGLARNTTGTGQETLLFYANTTTYDYIGLIITRDTNWFPFHISQLMQFANNDDIILSITKTVAGTYDIDLAELKFTVTKI